MNNAEVYPSKDGWRFRVRAANGEIMCVGEAYVRRIDAESALRQLFSQPVGVVVRHYGDAVIDHYTIGKEPTLDDGPELPADSMEETE